MVHIVSLAQMGVTIERIREQYDDMNEMYALTTDLAQSDFVCAAGRQRQTCRRLAPLVSRGGILA